MSNDKSKPPMSNDKSKMPAGLRKVIDALLADIKAAEDRGDAEEAARLRRKCRMLTS